MSVNKTPNFVMPLTAPGTWDAVINPKAVINNVPPLPFYGPMPMPGVGFAAPIPLNNYTSFLSANPKGGMSMNVPLIANASQAPAVAAMPMAFPVLNGGGNEKKGGFLAASVGPALSGFPVAPAFPLGRTGALPAATFGAAPIFGGPIMNPMGPNQSVVTIDNKPIATINNTPGAISGALGLGFPGVVGMGGLPKLQMTHPKLPLLPNAVGSVIPPMAAGPAIGIAPQFTHSAVTVAAPGRTVTTIAPNTNNFGSILSNLWDLFRPKTTSDNFSGSGILFITAVNDLVTLYRKERESSTEKGKFINVYEDAGGVILEDKDSVKNAKTIDEKLAYSAIEHFFKDGGIDPSKQVNMRTELFKKLTEKQTCKDSNGKDYHFNKYMDIDFKDDWGNNSFYRIYLIFDHTDKGNNTKNFPLTNLHICATANTNKCDGEIISVRVFNALITSMQRVMESTSFWFLVKNCGK